MAHKNPPKETQFKPGVSGNPKGKPKGTLSMRTQIQKILSTEIDELNPITGETERITVGDVLIMKQVLKAKKGDTRAFEVLKDHIEAKPKQGLDITSAGERIDGKEIVFREYKDGEE